MNFQVECPFLIIWLFLGSLSGDDTGGSKYLVEISGRTITVTCPSHLYKDDNKVKFVKKGVEKPERQDNDHYILENYSETKNGDYECSDSKGKKEYLFLKAYVCEHCTEISVPVLAGVLIGDCMVTLGVALAVYFGCKKKSGLPRDGGRKRVENKERPPPVPNPDYEPIRKGNQDVYNGLERNFK
ncbi:T-cell surface glycoprotein CD3 epsilon chain [Pelobates fuscus]|uniref:T-cell surface glycoprotein CD3 epsilon chain n=1 Tax=Pelobates fuscus TaxID=191477 RepID=UPI002FE49D52